VSPSVGLQHWRLPPSMVADTPTLPEALDVRFLFAPCLHKGRGWRPAYLFR
jgi:hypothetical protein